jgi:Xaa-Pro dipeptidase
VDREKRPINMTMNAHCNHPDSAELGGRLEKLQSAMADHGLDYYLCHDPANIFYLTNFANYVHERPFILLIPATGEMTFLAPKLEASHVRARAACDLQLLHYFEFPAPPGQGWQARLLDVLGREHRVGVESQCPLAVVDAVPGNSRMIDLVDELRQVKSDYEIARLAYTSKLLSDGHAQLLEAASPGQLPLLLHKEVSGALMQRLLTDNPNSNVLNSKFNAVVQPPSLSHDPHNFTDLFCTLEQGGPHVSIVQGLANGYGAEIERTWFINEIPEAARAPFTDMLEARALAAELAIPGASMSEVDRRVNELLQAKGYGGNLLHRTGHSFGVTDHEGPFLAEGYEREILPGMVFSIEPGIYLEGVGGFRFSDTVLVTADGNTRLTRGPETLEECLLTR